MRIGRRPAEEKNAPRDPAPRAELDALHETAVLVAERHAVPELLQLILERAAALVGGGDAYLYLRLPDETLEVVAGIGVFSGLTGFRLRVGEGLAGRVAADGEPIAVGDYTRWEGRTERLDTLPLGAVVGVPMRGSAGILGVIGLARGEEAPFGPQEIQLLDRFGRLAAIALDNARLHESAQEELAERRRTEDELLDAVARLSRSDLELRRAQAETIRRLADAAEFRDAETGRHTERMARICEQIALRLGLDEERCRLIRDASPLHDIGKIAIPDEILLKRGPLTEGERRTMQRHAEIGHRLLSGSTSGVLDMAAMIALTHHERWDGAGYPHGLAGEAIPLEGRVAAVADVFDALTADRVYRSAMPVDEALALMREERGTQFDPLVLDVLEAIIRDAEEAIAPDPEPLGSEEASVGGEEEPAPLLPAAGGSRRAELPERILQRATAAAARQAEHAQGRRTIEDALGALCAPFEGSVLASVYAVDHDRLWLVAQHGYAEVRDGFTLEHGVMGRCVRTRTIQQVGDVSLDADFIPATNGITSEAAVPIRAGGPVVGVLNVESLGVRLPRSAGSTLAELASLFGERVVESRGGLGTDVGDLVRLCVHASSLRGIGAIAELATRTTARILGLSSAQVDLWRHDGAQSRLVSFWRRHDLSLEPVAGEVLERLERTTGAQVTSSIVAARQVDPKGHSTGSFVVLPLRAGGEDVGLLTGRLDGTTPPKERLEAAMLFAQHTAALMDVAATLQREQRAAVTDQLTGLLNRRGFEERFRDEIRRATRDELPLSVVVCDLDGLKTVNDHRGHETGDALLELVASCLRTHKRSSDVAARLGGDEFALLLPNADIDTAVAVCDRVRGSITAETIAGFRPSASFGAASFPLHGTTIGDLMRVADDALYRAKERGGDEIVAHEE